MSLMNPKRMTDGPQGRVMVDDEMLEMAQQMAQSGEQMDPAQISADDWRQMIPEEVRGEAFWNKYQDLPAALRGMAEAQKLIGRREEGVRVPGPFATADELSGFYAAMGRPEAPDGYELPELELPGGLTPDEGVLGAFREKAHGLGLSADQVRGLYEWFVPHQAEMMQQMDRDRAAEQASEFANFRQEHGDAAPQKLAMARQAAMAIGGQELLEVLSNTGAGNSARVLNAFATIAPLVTEAGFEGDGIGAGGMTHAQLREMQRDPRYADPSRRDADFVRQVEAGYARLFPGTVENSASAKR